jgi:hypothetical protein
MRNKIFILLLTFFALFHLSCGNNSNAPSAQKKNEPAKFDSSKAFSGIFSGITPCADCPGIEMTVYFKPDSTFIENMVYMERNTSFSDTGKWSISDKIITVSFPKHQAYFLMKSDSVVSMLDSDKKEIGGDLSDKYSLRRKK